MEKWQGRVVWITGASSGIGEALAKAFWQQGASLVLAARRTNELDRVKTALGNRPGQLVMVLAMDLSDTSGAESWVHQVTGTFGRIDVLVNNAGVSQRSYAAETPMDVDRRIMEINYFGTVALSKAVLPVMLEAQSGQIVVISSISGKFGFYLRSAYAASKHALHGFFESLRMEVWKQGLKVMIVCPGKIRTDISVNALKGDGSAHGVMDPGQASGKSPEDLAERIMRGLDRGEEEVFFGGPEMKAVWIKRYFPKLFSRLIRKQKPE
jgi:dehydrogenase/reductase SDR family member 7B